MNELKRTPLYDEHVKLGAKIVDFAGYEMPIEYSGITDEHKTVRTEVGIFDVSHMGEVFIEGKDAESFVQKLVTGDVKKLNENQVMYSLMCYKNGTIVDDLLVYKYNREKFLLVVNASNTDKDYQWMLDNKPGFDVSADNKSNEYGQVALQGQTAQSILQQFTKFDLNEIKFFYFAEIDVNGIACIVSRTGYTGEDGFEIYCESKKIINIWQLLINAGVKPIGLGARDTLRFEACLPLYGDEISDEVTPIEAGLSYFVKLENDFNGRDVLLKQKEEGVTKKLVGLKLKQKGICRHGYPVCDQNKKEIGYITTGYLLPDHEYAAALAYVDAKEANLDNTVLVNVRNRYLEAQIISKKFMDKKYKK